MASAKRFSRLSSISKTNVTPVIKKEFLRKTTKTIGETSTESEEEDNENYNIINEMKAFSKNKNEFKNKEMEKSKSVRSTIRSDKTNKRKTHEVACEINEGEELVEASPPKLATLSLRFSPVTKEYMDASTGDNGKTTENGHQMSFKSNSPGRNKYQNARRILSCTETQKLPGREEKLQQLRDFFKEHVDNQRSGSLYISGQPGTGKTACLSLLLRSPDFAHRLKCVYINCTSVASVGGVYKKVCTELALHPIGRTERDYRDVIQQYLCTAQRMSLIVLDEIDQLCSTRQSVLYTIFEWPALPGAQLLLVGIANNLDLTDRVLMRLNSRCELKPHLMHFPPYSKQQIVNIFRTRLEEADVLDIFPPVTLQLLAAKVSAISGDVRRALDIGRRVVEIAEQKKKTGCKELNINDLDVGRESVQITQVADVLNKVYGASQNLQADIEQSFPLQQKVMLCSLLLMLRNERNKNINMARLYEVYRRVCIKRNIYILDQTELFGLVDLVETRGILRLVRKKEPRLSKVQLQWDEEEVNGALKDKQLIASILNDIDCLGK